MKGEDGLRCVKGVGLGLDIMLTKSCLLGYLTSHLR